MLLYEKDFEAPFDWANDVFETIEAFVVRSLLPGELPVRFVITSTADNSLCELGVLAGCNLPDAGQIFEFRPRRSQNQTSFNVVLLIPTGIGAELGGHDGDGGPVAQLLASVCDILITHPNVVNGSDINELPENGLYVEGSVISRFLMGQIGLRLVRSNRILVVLGSSREKFFVNAAINAVNAARATYGLNIPRVTVLDQEIIMRSKYAPSGRAVGRIEGGVDELTEILQNCRHEFDAVAIASTIEVDDQLRLDYYAGKKAVINPWGGVEAMLTHAISTLYNLPAAHAPMYDNLEYMFRDYGVVDPRIAAEAISVTFLQSVLKGLRRSPAIVSDSEFLNCPGVLSAADCSCLVIPDGCVGLPTLAALFQGIPVIAVRENRNLMRNELSALPWRPGQLVVVDNYWEAAGVINCLKAGLIPESVRRPLAKTSVVPSRKTRPSLSSTDLPSSLNQATHHG